MWQPLTKKEQGSSHEIQFVNPYDRSRGENTYLRHHFAIRIT